VLVYLIVELNQQNRYTNTFDLETCSEQSSHADFSKYQIDSTDISVKDQFLQPQITFYKQWLTKQVHTNWLNIQKVNWHCTYETNKNQY